MDMGKKIEALRREQGMTLEELGDKVGVGKSTVRKWENGMIANMRRDKIAKIAEALGVSPASLMGWEEKVRDQKPFELSDSERTHIEQYRALDQRGRNAVDYILDEEYSRSQLEETIEYHDDIVPMRYAGQRAAAGRWIFDENVPTEMILVKPKEGADFVIGISGDSMEPDYCDGDKVYIKRTTDLIFGEVGLFQIGDEYYIKELTPEGLRSVNPKYAVIPKSENIIVIGKVLGKAKEKKRWTPEKKQKAK